MKISLRNSKLNYVLIAFIALLNLLAVVFSSFVVFHFSRWIVLPIIFMLEAVLLTLILFKFEFSDNVSRVLKIVSLFFYPLIALFVVEFLQKSLSLGSIKSLFVNYFIFLGG